ncbi:MAG: Fe-S cluster assembly ATPase SufC [Gammaproteobacteria bacterium]|nr:Fe-S cluster assembly ATPase SufC [Gammaproteobacteria bacterium]
MLEISELYASVADKDILKGISLSIKPGEVHAIMGPNGSGKSTLANILSGREDYTVTNGVVTFKNHNLLDLSPEERAHLGIYQAFQYPVEIPGVSNINFLKSIVNANRKSQNLPEVNAIEFLQEVKAKLKQVGMSDELLYRSVNESFSGGEKKRNEILQMLMLKPDLIILDETDSGLDIDALKIVSEGVNQLRDKNRSFMVITHYQRLLDYIIPDYVHVLARGHIIKSGGKELALELETTGYSRLLDEL